MYGIILIRRNRNMTQENEADPKFMETAEWIPCESRTLAEKLYGAILSICEEGMSAELVV